MPFLFAAFALCASAGITHSREYDGELSPLHRPNEPSNMKVVWGIPNTEEQLLAKIKAYLFI